MNILTNLFNFPKKQKIGKYEIIRKLGSGQFGTVYLAEDPKDPSHEQVAIKVFQNADKDIDMNGFIKEASALLRISQPKISHPNIVKVLAFHYDDTEVPYLVMTYFPDGDLKKYLHGKHPLSLENIIKYIEQIADALQYAHDNNIIHRDVKPKNMLHGTNGEILLSDFGIATHTGTNGVQTSKNVIGTLAYMAPEQFDGKATKASDQYSLAIVAYEWLCERLPFQSIQEHLDEPPPPFPSERNIPTEVENVICKALAKNPQNRYHSVRQFADELKKAYIYHSATIMESVTLSGEDSIAIPPPIEPALSPPTPLSEKVITRNDYFSQWLAAFLFACGWGAIAGILLHSWIGATIAATSFTLLAHMLLYNKSKVQSVQSLPQTGFQRIIRQLIPFLSFLLMIPSIPFAGYTAFWLTQLPYSESDTSSFWIFGLHTQIIGQQIYFGLCVGGLVTSLTGTALAIMQKDNKHFLFFPLLFVWCLLWGLVAWLPLAMLATAQSRNFGLGPSSSVSLLSLLIGVMAMAGIIVEFSRWIKR